MAKKKLIVKAAEQEERQCEWCKGAHAGGVCPIRKCLIDTLEKDKDTVRVGC